MNSQCGQTQQICLSLGQAALQTAKTSYFMKIMIYSLIPNITDAFQLILKANPSEKFMVENILNIWASSEEKY